MVNERGVIKRYIVTPDKHAPLHDKKAISVVKQAIEILKPDGYIDLGDFSEWGSVSHWQWKNKKKPPLEYLVPAVNADIEATNKLFDEIDDSLDKANVQDRRFCMGNHEEWLTSFVDAHPYLTDYKYETLSGVIERGYKLYPAGEYFSIGKLHFYHGHHFGGQYHTANHLRKLGVSIMYGHYHSMQMMSATGLQGPIEAWCIGCLKDMSSEKNKWLKGRPHQWMHSFAIVDFYKGGDFAVTPVKIVDGKATLWGSTLKG